MAIDPTTGQVTRTWDVGIAPRQVKLVGNRLFVSNEGGRRATGSESTQDSYGTAVPADPTRGTSTNGTVSVIDPAAPGSAAGTVKVGLHPTSMYLKGSVLYVADTNDDTVSVVDTTKNRVVQTITAQPWRGSATGYVPTGITGHDNRLLVTPRPGERGRGLQAGQGPARPGQLRGAGAGAGADRLLPQGCVRRRR